jgi:AAA15 family ATPase/GTPase
MKEIISIENFGGLKKLEIDLKRINILIGPQASGKSVCVKLLYFFKGFVSEIFKSIENGNTKRELDSKQRETFVNYFPKEAWPKGSFKIEYRIKDSWIKVQREGVKSLIFDYSDEYKNLLAGGRKIFREEQNRVEKEPGISSLIVRNNARQKFDELVTSDLTRVATNNQFFVPAGRSFFANIQTSIFSFLSNNESLDPFLVEFGSFYESFKRFSGRDEVDSARNKVSTRRDIDKLINEILFGSFKSESDKDYIIHSDLRKVNLANASSGQQETLPLVLVLKVLSNLNLNNRGATIYIEEPEAHLFPTAQKKVIQLLARTFNSQNGDLQIIVTTHSPYILSSFNNLLEAGKVMIDKPNEVNKIFEIVPEQETINPKDLIAYSIFNGQKKILIDGETKLISENLLDSVSDDLAIDFGRLLDIEFGL